MLDLKILGENIRIYRVRRKLSQAQLAEQLMVSFQAVSSWERGVTPPDLDNLCKLSELFGVSVDALLGNDNLSREQVMIGIHCGGARTEFLLFTESGCVLQRLLLPQNNPTEIGFDACFNILQEGIDSLLDVAPEVQCIVAGMAGVFAPSNANRVAAFLKQRYRKIQSVIQSDVVNVLCSGSSSGEGMALLCGTGSALIVHKNGQNYRFGGWGPAIGDMGSAFQIGCSAIAACLHQVDGVGGETLLTKLMTETAGVSNAAELWNLYYERGKSHICSMVPDVFRAHQQGDPIASQILLENAEGVAKLLNSARQLHGAFPEVIASGSIFDQYRDVFEPMIQQYLTKPLRFVYPRMPQIYGACVSCCRVQRIPVTERFNNKFKETYRSMSMPAVSKEGE